MRKLLAAVAVTFFSAPIFGAEVESMMLLYKAKEQGVAPYTSRILVTKHFVRMDDGVDDGDYLVFDRKSRMISSVTHDDQTVFEIPPREVNVESPVPLKLRTEVVEPEQTPPKVAGQTPEHRKFYVNDSLCYSVVTVPVLMGDAVEALRDFRRVLAGEHAKTLPRIPADMQEPCDMALNTFAPDWQLKFGMPLQEWDEKGNGQMLVDFTQGFMVDEALFGLPKDYKHYDTNDL